MRDVHSLQRVQILLKRSEMAVDIILGAFVDREGDSDEGGRLELNCEIHWT